MVLLIIDVETMRHIPSLIAEKVADSTYGESQHGHPANEKLILFCESNASRCTEQTVVIPLAPGLNRKMKQISDGNSVPVLTNSITGIC